MRTVSVAAILAALALQEAQLPVFRARTDLVRLDVVVVDSDGRAVRGLTRDDFEVRERGRSPRIAAFDEVSHERGAELLPATLPLDVADNRAASDRLIVLVLDDLHFQAKTDLVKDMARRVVTGIGAKASLALVTTSGVFGVEPADDRSLLLSELDRFLDKFDPEGKRLVSGAHAPDPAPIHNALGTLVRERGPAGPGQFFADMTGFKTVADVAKKIRADAGRRNAFVWISGGMNRAVLSAACKGPGNDYYCSALDGMLEGLRKANATAYSIATHDFKSEILHDVAARSGGLVIDAENFDRDLPRLIDDLDHYYLIGFYPEDPPDDTFHPVDVRVKKPGLTVRHRGGYQPTPAAKAAPGAKALARMSEGALPVADLPLRLTAVPIGAPGARASQVAIALEIRADRGPLADTDGHLRDEVRYEIWAVDLRRKKAVASVARLARLDLNPPEAAAAEGDPVVFQVHTVLALTPGRYQLRGSVTSARTGKGGSVFHAIEVADTMRGSVPGPIVLAYAAGPRVPVVRGGTGIVLLPIAPTLDREFPRSETLRIVSTVPPHVQGSAAVALDLLRSDGTLVKRIATHHGADPEISRFDETLPLADLPAGGYRLRVTGTTGVEREIGFIVR
jgi:VWFA-related protein